MNGIQQYLQRSKAFRKSDACSVSSSQFRTRQFYTIDEYVKVVNIIVEGECSLSSSCCSCLGSSGLRKNINNIFPRYTSTNRRQNLVHLSMGISDGDITTNFQISDCRKSCGVDITLNITYETTCSGSNARSVDVSSTDKSCRSYITSQISCYISYKSTTSGYDTGNGSSCNGNIVIKRNCNTVRCSRRGELSHQ